MPSQEALAAVLQTAQKVIEDQSVEIQHLQKQLFGRRSEKVPAGQLSLFAQLLQAVAERVPQREPEEDETPLPKEKSKKKARRKPLTPTQTIEIPIPEDERPCPECGAMRCTIGHARSLVVEYTPPKFEVIEYLRETLACKPCEGEISRSEGPKTRARGEHSVDRRDLAGRVEVGELRGCAR